MMKKILVALFIVIILGIGIVGYVQANDQPNEVVDDDNHSITVESS